MHLCRGVAASIYHGAAITVISCWTTPTDYHSLSQSLHSRDLPAIHWIQQSSGQSRAHVNLSFVWRHLFYIMALKNGAVDSCDEGPAIQLYEDNQPWKVARTIPQRLLLYFQVIFWSAGDWVGSLVGYTAALWNDTCCVDVCLWASIHAVLWNNLWNDLCCALTITWQSTMCF